MSSLSPLAAGLGAGAMATAVAGFGGYQLMDGIGERNPTGNDADGKARAVQWGLVGLGAAAAVGGFFAGGRGFGASTLGAALIGGGIGSAIGGLAASWGFERKHGIGIDTRTRDLFNSYNRGFDDELDLDTRWRTPENVRRIEHRHEDSHGHVHYTYTYYTIDRLTSKADVDGNSKVTRPELRAAVADYDADGNGRIQGEEARRYDREVGERSWYGGWF